MAEIRARSDLERARRDARTMAIDAGFSEDDGERIAIVVTELATNLLKYAIDGWIEIALVETEHGPAIQIESLDHGPGIPNVPLALNDGYSTSGGLGGGLPGVGRLMDEFEIDTSPNGTRIMARKWLTSQS